jgi:hypothetical protein
MESKYTITNLPDGFRVEGTDRVSVTVRAEDTRYRITHVSPYNNTVETHDFVSPIAEHLVVTRIADGLLSAWSKGVIADNKTFLLKWGKDNCARSIHKRVRAALDECSHLVTPHVREVHKAFWAVGAKLPDVAWNGRIYEDPYIVSDIVNYRSAACMGFCVDGVMIAKGVYDTDEVAASMRHWKELYSDTGTPYTSLNKTLMNFPGGVPPRLAQNLRYHHLSSPITDRVKLIALTAAIGDRAMDMGDHRCPNVEIIEHATREQIIEAVQLVPTNLIAGRQWNTRKPWDIQKAIVYITDYPNEHGGNVITLAHRAVRWHDEVYNRRYPANADNDVADGAEVKLPAIALPSEEGITLLKTAGEVKAEGESMRHCIRMYAQGAVDGSHFLFHIEHDGEKASVQVDSRGYVIQAYGPHNCKNKAVEWGTRVLSKWGKGLKPVELVSAYGNRTQPADLDWHNNLAQPADFDW